MNNFFISVADFKIKVSHEWKNNPADMDYSIAPAVECDFELFLKREDVCREKELSKNEVGGFFESALHRKIAECFP